LKSLIVVFGACVTYLLTLLHEYSRYFPSFSLEGRTSAGHRGNQDSVLCHFDSWWGVGIAEPGREVFFLFPAPAQLFSYAKHMFKNISTPKSNQICQTIHSTFTAYDRHMQSMNSVLLCRNAFRATCDNSRRKILAKHMLKYIRVDEDGCDENLKRG